MSFSNFQAPVFHPEKDESGSKWTVSAEDSVHNVRVVAEFPVLLASKFEIEASRQLALSFIRANVPLRPYAWTAEYSDGSTHTWDQPGCPAGMEHKAFPVFRERDNCEVCFGAKGGVKGNENRIDEVVVCDYCHAAMPSNGMVT